MTNLQLWSLVVGFVLPPVQSIIQQTHWTRGVRAVVNFAVCAVVALGVVYFEASVDFHNWVRAFLMVFVAAIATYNGLWQPTGISPKVEKATTI